MDFGKLNGHSVGFIMKELVWRALMKIRAMRFEFEVHPKQTPGRDDDVVTSADYASQGVYSKSLRECFPQYGIIAEEGHLRIRSRNGFLFTVDPLDGTLAFKRKQSHGIGTMLALGDVQERVLAAYVGDIMTQEIFGFRPDSKKVHRISEFQISQDLSIDPRRPLSTQYVLLRNPTELHSRTTHILCSREMGMGLFHGIEVSGGSIGIGFARLWKSEVGAMILRPCVETPWDSWPIIGISQKLGFQFFALCKSKFKRWTPKISTRTWKRNFEVLVIHKSRVSEFENWQERNIL